MFLTISLKQKLKNYPIIYPLISIQTFIQFLTHRSFLYAFYREDDGTPRTPRLDNFGTVPTVNGIPVASENTVRTANYPWLTVNGVLEKETMLIVTPRVVREVRDHFGCQELEGAELEGEGGASSVGSHWDLRTFINEVRIVNPPVIIRNTRILYVTHKIMRLFVANDTSDILQRPAPFQDNTSSPRRLRLVHS